MTKSDAKIELKKLLEKALRGELEKLAITYLNTKFSPNSIGVTYNTSYFVERFCYAGSLWYKKHIHLVFREETVDCIEGQGMNERRGSSTYPAHVWAFADKIDADRFSHLSNIAYNREHVEQAA
jgi:hypothetical protein